jgi:hypothetical protein
MDPENTPHCPGCRGYTPRWEAECPGITTGVVVHQRVVGKLPWRLRWRVLAGRPVITAAGATAWGGGGGGGCG